MVVAGLFVIGILSIFFYCILSRQKYKQPENENTNRKSNYVYRPRDDEIVQKSVQAAVIDDDLPDGEGA